MKIIVSVIVFNRVENIKRWLHIWAQCDRQNAELVIIHTGQGNEIESLCKESNIKYIKRQNIGFDIGTMQDVFTNRLKGFPEWDFVIWCTDDTFPMTPDFIQLYMEKMQPGVGVACMQLSPSVSPHVRTTGFCIARSTAQDIEFPTDPITSKNQCYLFEHRGGRNTFTNQIRNMGLACVQVARNEISPMWDSGYWKRLDRQDELDDRFGGGKKKGDKVVFICTIFNTYPQIISCLLLQTHKNWELILIHDGPNETGLRRIVECASDSRIRYIETAERVGNWGHSLRAKCLDEMDLGDYVVITNADNYYVPVFCDYMIKGFKSHTAVATYCTSMTHSYKAWEVIVVKMQVGFIDCGGVMVKSEVAKEVGWRDTESHSSDWTYFSDIAGRYSWKNFIPVKGNLFIHN